MSKIQEFANRFGISHTKYIVITAYGANALGSLYNGNIKEAAIVTGIGGLATIVMYCADKCLDKFSQ